MRKRTARKPKKSAKHLHWRTLFIVGVLVVGCVASIWLDIEVTNVGVKIPTLKQRVMDLEKEQEKLQSEEATVKNRDFVKDRAFEMGLVESRVMPNIIDVSANQG